MIFLFFSFSFLGGRGCLNFPADLLPPPLSSSSSAATSLASHSSRLLDVPNSAGLSSAAAAAAADDDVLLVCDVLWNAIELEKKFVPAACVGGGGGGSDSIPSNYSARIILRLQLASIAASCDVDLLIRHKNPTSPTGGTWTIESFA